MAAGSKGDETSDISINNEDRDQEKDWVKVQGRKNGTKGNGEINNNMHAIGGNDKNSNPSPRKNILDRMSMSFYITNFPQYVTNKDLWNECAAWGTVCDVFIANRLSKAGKRFAFVRFIKVSDANRLLSDLKSMWIAKYKLYVDVVRFNRSFNNRPPMKIVNGEPTKKLQENISSNGDNGRSYVEALSGTKGKGEAVNTPLPKRRIVNVSLSKDNLPDDQPCNLIKLKDPAAIPYVKIWLNSEGFLDLEVHYIGGRWMVVRFGTVEVQERFLASDNIKANLVAIKSMTNEFIPDERMVWVEIHGLPRGAWHKQAINEITDTWGKGTFFDIDWLSGTSVVKVCLLSQTKSFIFEELSIKVEDKLLPIWLKEFATWEPSILHQSNEGSGSEGSNGEDDYEDSVDSNCKNSVDGESEGDSSDRVGGHSAEFDPNLCKDNSNSNGAKLGPDVEEDSFFKTSISSPLEKPDLSETKSTEVDLQSDQIGNKDEAEIILGSKIPSASKPAVSPTEGLKVAMDNDIFSLERIILNETKQNKEYYPSPPGPRQVSSESSGAPGFFKGVFPPLQAVDVDALLSGNTNSAATSSVKTTNVTEDMKQILETGKYMGFGILEHARSFGDIVSGMSEDKAFQ